MDTVALSAQRRDREVRSRDLRRERQIPAVFYGFGKETMPLTLNYIEFRDAYKKAGKNTIIDLAVSGESLKVLVHEVQYDPVYDTFAHVDFVNVRMDRELHTSIPLHFVGVSLAVKDLGGILNVTREEVQIKCLPDKLPHGFELDLSVLKEFHDALHVKDIQVPEGVTMLEDPELVVATVSAPKEEVEEAPVTVAGEEAVAGEAVAGEAAAEGAEEKTGDGGGE